MSFVDCIRASNAMIKSPIYFTSHMRIARKIMGIIPEWFYVSTKDKKSLYSKHEQSSKERTSGWHMMEKITMVFQTSAKNWFENRR